MDINGRLNQAFKVVKREDFLIEDYKKYADMNGPLPVGFGQTNSQPATVRFMLEKLELNVGDKVLDVGSGSGWTTALLANLVGDTGKVVGVEIVPELVKFGSENLAKYPYGWAKIIPAEKHVLGHPRESPYSRILVSASADKMPMQLTDQLALGGRMVIPVEDSIYSVDKDEQGNLVTKEFPGFVFVPLI